MGQRGRITAALPLLTATCALLASCGGVGVTTPSDTSPAPDPALDVTTTSLPLGWVGHKYAAALSATGGTAPLSWTLTGGALPAGLAVSANGAISGSPTAPAGDTPLTFTVTDSYATPRSRSVTLKLSVTPANITVSVSPARAAL